MKNNYGNSVEVKITSITHKLFLIFSDIISFQHVLHFDGSRSEIEWNLKVKTDISVFE